MNREFEASPILLHIAESELWESQKETNSYTPASFEEDGFIHASLPRQVTDVANRYYEGRADLVLLVIDTGRVEAPTRFEDLTGEGDRYPHIYGPLNVAAVTAVHPLVPRDDGRFGDFAALPFN